MPQPILKEEHVPEVAVSNKARSTIYVGRSSA